MLSIAALIASLAFLALVVAAIPALLQLRRTAHTTEQTLAAIEREVRPLTSQIHALLQEHRELAQRATRDLREVEGILLHVQELLGRVGKLTGFLGSLGTVGQVVGVALSLRKGVDAFIHRLSQRR